MFFLFTSESEVGKVALKQLSRLGSAWQPLCQQRSTFGRVAGAISSDCGS